MGKYIIIVLFIFFGESVFAQAQDYDYKNYQIDSSLPASTKDWMVTDGLDSPDINNLESFFLNREYSKMSFWICDKSDAFIIGAGGLEGVYDCNGNIIHIFEDESEIIEVYYEVIQPEWWQIFRKTKTGWTYKMRYDLMDPSLTGIGADRFFQRYYAGRWE